MTPSHDVDLGPENVSAYLRLSGWRLATGGHAAALWEHVHRDDEALLVPQVPDAPDYGKRVALLTDELARVEDRDPQLVQEDIVRVYFDVSDLRAEHADIDDSISLQAGVELYASAKRMIIAAAGATIRRQGHFGRSMPSQAKEHAKHVRVGHTRRGSYVVPIISQAKVLAPERPDRLDMEAEESLFDRRVMTTLARSLSTLRELVVGPVLPSRRDIIESVGQGVSKELSTAVAGALRQDDVDVLDIDFRWAPAAGAPRDVPSRVEFSREVVGSLFHVAEVLKTSHDTREDVLFGVVTDLHQHPGEDFGRVGIEAAVGRRVRTVWMELSMSDLRTATQCFDERRKVVARGRLRAPAGDRATMESVSFFGPELSLTEHG